jgi:hypothetical protein
MSDMTGATYMYEAGLITKRGEMRFAKGALRSSYHGFHTDNMQVDMWTMSCEPPRTYCVISESRIRFSPAIAKEEHGAEASTSHSFTLIKTD